jgi:hypothetical protein
MLDVHLPHKPLHGFWEFLLHLFTISVGLLIATQIESCVEWRHHVHLAEQARASLRIEIEHNLKDLKAAEAGLKQRREEVEKDLKVVQRIQKQPNDTAAQHSGLELNSGGLRLSDTAWRTSQSTGALAYMPYDEAEKYASIYEYQTMLLAAEDRPVEDVAGIMGLISRYHWGESGKVTAEQASALAERFGQMRIHQADDEVLLKECIELSQAFLENRIPKGDFSERLH